MNKKKFLSLIIFIAVGQLVAYVFGLWIDFPNGQDIMLISSLVGFIFSYKEQPVEKEK